LNWISVNGDFAAAGRKKAADEGKQSALATAALPDNYDELLILDGQVYVLQCCNFPGFCMIVQTYVA
jgi:hypothetical protein